MKVKIFFLSAYEPEAYKEELSNMEFDGFIDKMNFEKVVSNYLNN